MAIVEPMLQRAGDERVLVNGSPLTVDFRIVYEGLYQHQQAEIAALKAEVERLKSLTDIDPDLTVVVFDNADDYEGFIAAIQLKAKAEVLREVREKIFEEADCELRAGVFASVEVIDSLLKQMEEQG